MPEYTNPSGGSAQPKPHKPLASQYKKRAYVMEVGLAKDLTASGQPSKRVPMSGALKGVALDGDVESKHFLIEAKNYTPVEVKGATYIRFPVSWLTKIMAEAKLHGKPGLVVLQPKGSKTKFVVADWDQFCEVVVKALPK